MTVRSGRSGGAPRGRPGAVGPPRTAPRGVRSGPEGAAELEGAVGPRSGRGTEPGSGGGGRERSVPARRLGEPRPREGHLQRTRRGAPGGGGGRPGGARVPQTPCSGSGAELRAPSGPGGGAAGPSRPSPGMESRCGPGPECWGGRSMPRWEPRAPDRPRTVPAVLEVSCGPGPWARSLALNPVP